MHSLQNSTHVSDDFRVRRQCQLAKERENVGDYEGALAALSGVWSAIGECPRVEKLSAYSQAELLLRAGSISGWLGSAQQVGGAQEFAKNLIAESQRLFYDQGDHEKSAEAKIDLALCYWRSGSLDDGQLIFREALSETRSRITRLRALISSTTVEISSGHYEIALDLLHEAARLIDGATDPAIRGRFHNSVGLAHKKMGAFEDALKEYDAARLFLHKAGNQRHLAIVENNVGAVLLQQGRNVESVLHLDRALKMFESVKDAGRQAEVNETRAQAFIAQRKYEEAERAALAAVTTLGGGDEPMPLAEALISLGIAQARLGKAASGRDAFLRAADLTRLAGNLNASGNAYLVMIEELRGFLAPGEVAQFLVEGDERLGSILRPESIPHLRACMRIAIDSLKRDKSSGTGEALLSGSLQEELFRFEAQLIERALAQANGSVTQAARLLGLTHQALAWSLNHRHRELLRFRTPPRRRQRSLIKPTEH